MVLTAIDIRRLGQKIRNNAIRATGNLARIIKTTKQARFDNRSMMKIATELQEAYRMEKEIEDLLRELAYTE